MAKVVKVKTGSPTAASGSYSRIVMVDNMIFIQDLVVCSPPACNSTTRGKP